MYLILWPIVTAILNRIRGGMLGDKIRELGVTFWGTTVNRLVTSSLLLLPILLLHTISTYIITVLLYYLFLLFGWSKWQYMESGSYDIIPMSIRGLILTLPSGLYSELYIFAISGILMGLSYYLPHLINHDFYYPKDYKWHSSNTWIQTSYNNNFRGHYAAIGDRYDQDLDIFIAFKPYQSWILNLQTGYWESSIPYPTDGLRYEWNESEVSWKLVAE